ncbi:phosphoribosylglycinamide formyltransferase [Priestia taiwanensis]|uniref:Phosphoribosylglycinamide formyltransferase n=1 Tax=Priestia taiwanensis TaxID=1347902 RepID=A0A917AY52_9BACI|nr:phosphoribosylglycinamide formyltransferase [Priestia taiwanensis]MBM7364829.1 phosphoribosylglycinamide formyltransferase-1 [Priestia taiwanensis]GGE79994.1 phosphoribosylglycinamide formyltransferase [Priestia taiwanensis]
MKRVAIFASGSGSNFQAIVDATRLGELEADVCLLVCDKPDAYVVQRALQSGIPTFAFNPKEYASKQHFELAILEELQKHDIDFIVLAGYMRLIGDTLLHAYGGRMTNIHPSLLPSFPGKDAIWQALHAGVKITGVSIHYVDEGMDTGPIIAQTAVEIDEYDTLQSLEKKVHAVEHALYIHTLQHIFQKERQEV